MAREAGDSSPERSKSEYELTQEQLAEIYFSSTGSEKQARPKLASGLPQQPLVIRVVEKPGLASVIPWIITSIAFLVTAFSLFSTKRVFVDIKIVDDKAIVREAEPREAAPEISEADRVSLRGAVFEGAAKLQSSSEKDAMTLVNSSVAPFARASVRMVPTNLTGCKIVFDARGGRGGEQLGFSLKDKDNVMAFERGKIFPMPEGLGTDWRRIEIPLTGTVSGFNPRGVVSMRFEFGSNVSNKPGDTVYVRNLQIL